jgi:dinuclear metal center YbgI/SA1388 family protein
MAAPLKEIVRFLDEYLRIGEVADDPNAVNGLQVEASEEVRTVACAVDAGEPSIEQAAGAAELLLVHHGLFWAGNRPITGPQARKLRTCFGRGLSVYGAHLPLDVHPEAGNNVGLLRALGLAPDGTFGRWQGVEIGLTATCELGLDELCQRLRDGVGEYRLAGARRERVRRIGVVTGGGGSLAGAAARAGLDVLITGEAPHYAALEAEERGLGLILAGHYRTERFGVKAVAELLAERFGLDHFFVEHDTGL